MSDAPNYRERAQDLRTDARATLAALREARVAKRKDSQPQTGLSRTLPMETESDLPPQPGPEPVASDLHDDAVGASLAIIAEDELAAFADTPEPDMPGHDAVSDASCEDAGQGPAAESPAEDADPVHASDALSVEPQIDESEISTDAESDFDGPAAAALEDLPRGEVEDAPPEVPAETAMDETMSMEAPPAGESDLLKLPGAGVGLVWILAQCGIRDLADLAACDAKTLSPRLGIIGQIIDFESWIAFAREDTAAATGDRAAG